MATFTKETGINTARLDGSTATVNSVAITVLLSDGSGNVLMATGTTVPTDASSGYAKGCQFIKTDAAATVGGVYLNKGTTSSSQFTGVTQA